MDTADIKKTAEAVETPEASETEKAYKTRLALFQKNYLTLVVAVGVALLGGIALAIHLNVWLGIAIALLAAAVYVYFSPRECKRVLGIGYKNTDGRIVITRAVPREGKTVIIPERLIWADVTDIARGALAVGEGELCEVYVPKSVTRIGENIFGDEIGELTVRFQGNAEEWAAVEKHTDFEGITLVFDTPYPTLPKKQRKKKKRGKEETR